MSLDPCSPVTLPAWLPRRRWGLPGSCTNPCSLATLLDPGETSALGHSQRFGAADAFFDDPGSPIFCLSRLNHAARALAVYASWGGSPRRCTQDSLPVGGRPLPRGSSTRWVRIGRFQRWATSSIPLPQASPGATKKAGRFSHLREPLLESRRRRSTLPLPSTQKQPEGSKGQPG